MPGNMTTNLMAILPEICLVILSIVLLAVDALARKKGQQIIAWVAFAGLILAFVLTWLVNWPVETAQLVWGNLIILDGASFVFKLLFLLGAALTVLFSLDHEGLTDHGEFYILLVISTLGMSLMASANNLIMLYLAIETTSIPLYMLAGFVTGERKSAEAGMKYFLFGATTSAIMLFGFSLLYGFSGTTDLAQIGAALTTSQFPLYLIMAAFVLVLVGFGFKVSAVPFHFWAPDVYEGAPTPITGFLSTASKAAGFAVLLRFLFAVFPSVIVNWSIIIAVISAVTMIVGNLLALTQKNIKRLLAYSSIAQAGYMLIGVAAASDLGASGTVYYLIAYLLTNIAAFGLISIIGKHLGSDEISAYAGLSRRSPLLAFFLLIAFLSLAGIPPFGGFIGKVLVFASAVNSSNLLWLAILGIINAIIALYYYLTVLKVVYLYRSEQEEKPIILASGRKAVLSFCIAGIIVVGFVIAPFFGLSSTAAAAFLGF